MNRPPARLRRFLARGLRAVRERVRILMHRRRIAAAFDADHYRATNPDVAAAGLDPATHYIRFGWREGRDPSADFDVDWYLATYPDVAAAGTEPLLHYLDHGAVEGRKPSPTSNGARLQPAEAAAGRRGLAALRRFARLAARPGDAAGSKHLARIAGVFDAAHYLLSHPGVAGGAVDPLTHYVTEGWRLGWNPSPHFDVAFYLGTYPDVRQAGAEPLLHYLDHGAREDRDPAPHFDTSFYRAENPGCDADGLTPLEHYLRQGARWGARTRPPQQAAAMGPYPSAEALTSAGEALAALAGLEPGLRPLAARLGELPVEPAPPRHRDTAWRALLQGLARAPRYLVLVPHLDAPGLAQASAPLLPAAMRERPAWPLLVLATDEGPPGQTLPPEAGLPPDVAWQSLSDFLGPGATSERLVLTLALVHAVQPETILVAGSEVGAELVERHGKAIGSYAALHALALPGLPVDADPVVRRLLGTLPHLSTLRTEDPGMRERLARLGLPRALLGRILPLLPPEPAGPTALDHPAATRPETKTPWMSAPS